MGGLEETVVHHIRVLDGETPSITYACRSRPYAARAVSSMRVLVTSRSITTFPAVVDILHTIKRYGSRWTLGNMDLTARVAITTQVRPNIYSASTQVIVPAQTRPDVRTILGWNLFDIEL